VADVDDGTTLEAVEDDAQVVHLRADTGVLEGAVGVSVACEGESDGRQAAIGEGIGQSDRPRTRAVGGQPVSDDDDGFGGGGDVDPGRRQALSPGVDERSVHRVAR
jgi:hypothetical protein